ncbi:MAG: nitrogenase component 1 [Eubacteriales bacterium]
MSHFSFFLPPLAPDYSGVSSVFFDLNTVTAMHDASGCTGNYTGYDEPRWYGSRAGIFCSGMRELDAIMGDDEKLIGRMIQAKEDLNPEVLVVVGSPVPMVIGSDMKGIAMEIECRTQLPSFGFDTTGTKYYDYGVVLACNELIDRFCEPMDIVTGRVNLVGANPLDFAKGEDLPILRALLEDAGYTVPLCLSQGYTLDQLREAASAQVNVAISRSGYLIAKHLHKRFGTPYLCALPVGSGSEVDFLDRLQTVVKTGESAVPHQTVEGTASTLIISEQVQGNAIRNWLASHCSVPAHVATLYGLEEELACEGDVDLPNERAIRNIAKEGHYQTIITDPCICELLEKYGQRNCIPLAQYAVSSRFHHKSGPFLIQQNFVSEAALSQL